MKIPHHEPNNPKLQHVLTAIRSGNHTPEKIAVNVKLSVRQVLRYIESAIALGLVYQPERRKRIYYTSDQPVLSYHQFLKNMVSSEDMSVEMSMSQNKQQNITTQNSDSVEFARKLYMAKEPNLQKRVIENDEMTNDVTSDEPEIYATLYLIQKHSKWLIDVSDFPKLAAILAQCDWRRINEDNVVEYCEETWRRFFEKESKNAKITKQVNYWFGILKYLVREKFVENNRIRREAYLEYLKQGNENAMEQVAAGAESLSQVHSSINTETPIIETKPTDNSEAERHEIEETLEDEWRDVYNLVVNMGREVSPYPINSTQILQMIRQLKDSNWNAQRTYQALDTLMKNDVRGALYFLSNLNQPETVHKVITKNYGRFLGLNNSASSSSTSNANVRDERYAAFYKLFDQ